MTYHIFFYFSAINLYHIINYVECVSLRVICFLSDMILLNHTLLKTRIKITREIHITKTNYSNESRGFARALQLLLTYVLYVYISKRDFFYLRIFMLS